MYKERLNSLLESFADPDKSKDVAIFIKYRTCDYMKDNETLIDYISQKMLSLIKYTFYRRAYFPRLIDKDIYSLSIEHEIDKIRINTLKELLLRAIRDLIIINSLCKEIGIEALDESINDLTIKENYCYNIPLFQKSETIINGISDEFIGGIRYDN